MFELPISQMLIPPSGPSMSPMITHLFNPDRDGPGSALSLLSMVVAGGGAGLFWLAMQRPVRRPSLSMGSNPVDARPAAAHPGSGAVIARAFQGRCWRLVVALGGQHVRLDSPEGPAIGAQLRVSLPPERCLVLAQQT